MSKEELLKDLKTVIENRVYKRGHNGTRFYLLSLDELHEIISVLENE